MPAKLIPWKSDLDKKKPNEQVAESLEKQSIHAHWPSNLVEILAFIREAGHRTNTNNF